MNEMTREVDAADIVWTKAMRFLNVSDETGNGEDEDGAEDAIVYNDSRVIRDTMMVYGSAMLVILLLFCFARRRYPKVYNLRNWVDPIKSEIATTQGGFFSWMTKVHHFTDDEFLNECGMDALCFIRIAQMGFKMS